MLAKLQVTDFVNEVASNSPAPGGGSVSALSAALGAGLLSMLANLTIGKKGYEEFEPQMKLIAAEAGKAAEHFSAVIDEDSKAFDVYMDAIRMPKDTDKQKQARSQAMQKAAEGATLVPLNLARDAYALTKHIEYCIANGNKNATSDGAVAMLMLRGAVLGAIYNVRINLPTLKNEELKTKILNEINALEQNIKEREAQVLGLVQL